MKKVDLTVTEIFIMSDIFARTPVKDFNAAIDSYNIQFIYERCRNYLVNTYFHGNVLKYAVEMRKLFNKFQTIEQEQKQKELAEKLDQLSEKIRRKKLYKSPHSNEVQEHNELAKQHQALAGNINQFTKLYLLYYQSNKTKAV